MTVAKKVFDFTMTKGELLKYVSEVIEKFESISLGHELSLRINENTRRTPCSGQDIRIVDGGSLGVNTLLANSFAVKTAGSPDSNYLRLCGKVMFG